MLIEWDDSKAATNLAKHGVAFESVRRFDFDGALIRADLRSGDPEGRLFALGLIDGRLHALVFVIRRAIRVISLRKASNREIARFEAQAG